MEIKMLAQKSCKNQKTAKSKKWIYIKKAEAFKVINLNTQLGLFLTSGARKTFIKLKQAFIKASILNRFDPERHIQIETDVLGYAIGRIFSQLTSDDLGQ